MSQHEASPQPEEPNFRYATAYRYQTAERRTVGLTSFFANSSSRHGGIIAGEVVRVICEKGDEVHRRGDGTIVTNNLFPSTESMNLRERIGNRIGKIIVGFVGESSITTYVPLPDSALSPKKLVEMQQLNEMASSIHIEHVVPGSAPPRTHPRVTHQIH